MITRINLTVNPGDTINERFLTHAAAKQTGLSPGEINAVHILKKSVDARRKNIKIILRCEIFAGDSFPGENTGTFTLPEWKEADPAKRVIIVGSGPAGLFAALRLLEDGITPIIVERGADAETRKKDIDKIPETQRINPESNYCFGEGGAGTFSDGKLYTRSDKRGSVAKTVEIFCAHGGSSRLRTDAHPHIGTEKLPAIIKAVRQTIISRGGQIKFLTKCTALLTDKNGVCGIKTQTGEEITGRAVILACGHSTYDLYGILEKAALDRGHKPEELIAAKTFAMGVRVEHPRELIDSIQYHRNKMEMPAAEYRLSAQCGNRGVYTFCMCPGGIVVPASSSDEEIVVNGMSPSGRDTGWSNSAVVVEIRPEDIGAENSPGKALLFQQELGFETKRQGESQRAPAQRLTDFLEGKLSSSFPASSYTPGLVPSVLDTWMPEHIISRLKEGFEIFGKKMNGFITSEALLIASETRTSSPVRILRDKETLESTVLPGLYPAGEGAGYSGGIVSSAMDGEKCAAKIAEKFFNT